MNNSTPPFLDKTMSRKRKNKKRKIIIINTAVILAIVTGTFFILVMLGFDSSFAKQFKNFNISITPIPTAHNKLLMTTHIIPTINKTSVPGTKELKLTPTLSPSSEPYLHPGDKDNKFSDGKIKTDELSYRSKNLSIEIFTIKKYDNVIYVAEVYFRSMENFKPVFANGKFHGGYQTTSQMAEDEEAVFAINSDSAAAIDYGIIIRNQIVYRDKVVGDQKTIFNDGSMQIYNSQISVPAILWMKAHSMYFVLVLYC